MRIKRGRQPKALITRSENRRASGLKSLIRKGVRGKNMLGSSKFESNKLPVIKPVRAIDGDMPRLSLLKIDDECSRKFWALTRDL
jgi:hypothetical protein